MDETTRNREEQVLKDAVLRGDAAAWEALYRRGFRPLWAFISARTSGQRDVAEEITQECWMIAVRRLKDFDPHRAPFEAWLKGIAERLLMNHQRSLRRRPKPDPRTPMDLAAPTQDPDRTERVLLALTALPSSYQEVLRAKYERGLAVVEIATKMGRTQKAVESLLSRARDAFREVWRRLET
jgi:RNA polymerase sigma-70 factor (ECF subfamily)